MRFRTLLLLGAMFTAACANKTMTAPSAAKYSDRTDIHSYANPASAVVKHVALDLDVSFERKILSGTATLTLERPKPNDPVTLDTRDLEISNVEGSANSKTWHSRPFRLGKPDRILGAPLSIQLDSADKYVRVFYETSPNASGLQWLTPAQTAGKRLPYLFSQSQAIHARSWIPLQDSPGIRVTYEATIRTPPNLSAVMSARNDSRGKSGGSFRFAMPQAVPSYLIAIAVGDVKYESLSPRTGVYAEPSVLPSATREFSDTEKMVAAAERLYGPYRWEQYDLLVLPPSFPFGGMENPRLTFATPTVIAGDKSLVGLVAHELAHSWSGNLVTNATWRDFWLNEGFTTYFERRIQEEVYGRERSETEALLSRQELESQLKSLPPKDQLLYLNLKGRDPDDGVTDVAYVKGMLLLRRLEEVFGRERWDKFLRTYFDHFAFSSITTGEFGAYLNENLLRENEGLARQINLDEWLSKPGLPADAPMPKSSALQRVDDAASLWRAGNLKIADIPVRSWSYGETLRFLRGIDNNLNATNMAELDQAYSFGSTGNSEILFQWLLLSIRHGYALTDPKLEEFLTRVGRRKFIKPLYEELVKTEAGKKRAAAIYAKARPGYHPIAQASIDAVLNPISAK